MGVALVIGPDQAGERLDRFLAGAVPGLSRSQAQRLIEEGRVQVAGRQAKANLALKERFKLRIVGPEAEQAKIPGIDETVEQGSVIHLGEERIAA